ncbi:DeoR/GlpR family DNA-binding transcription regulator [Streptomyces yokosukanensis]|uniref:DeoR/GlpR family DNA-binding transcription regulator n=1 Tax=Streptomyces yokosukanensis TaxID=67386 RepID=UPI000B13FFC8|nr:DeoR/GlpR family DNA-binding transcription regulator [Streptomyces yokosukanensis]
MQGDERQQLILERARGQGSVGVRVLARELDVSSETIRRDLRVLESYGLLRRTHGGAYPVETRSFETSWETRTRRLVPEQRRIAAAAVGLIGPAETVFVDEGSTPELVAEALPGDRPLTVVTAALAVAHRLSRRENTTVILLGGQVRRSTRSVAGPWVEQMLSEFVIDLAFVGANGISWEHGLTTPEPAAAKIKAQVMKVSRRKVFCGVHTTFGAVGFCRFADVREFEAIITDTGLPLAQARPFAREGGRVLRV